MNKLEKVKPFTKFCSSIGNIPTSYLISMTYEEQLIWLCNFLENVVIPTINDNNNKIESLYNYVNYYFDNLDVQEEIDNKLDEMAESGELAEIISLYLEMNCVLAYNTKDDLKNGTNLIDGSIARTLGTSSYNDGYGYFYKIRTKTEQDVIDEDNILSLINFDTLIAEKIIDKNIQDLENDITLINNNISTRLKIYYINTSNTFAEIQTMMNNPNPKILNFEKGNYTFNDTFILNANTKLLFNNSIITFNIPKVTEDSSKSHGFFNFLPNDEFLEYNGNGNIEFIGGTIIHGNASFCHAKGIKFINMNFEDCWNDHILEMCGINGLYVENCSFNGNIAPNIRKEYIQLDDCLRENFPWFTNIDNPTYDGTINKNWFIINNEFDVPNDSLGGVCFIGNHGYDNLLHTNIIIKNNIFKNTKNMSIQLYNIDELVIEDNLFYTNKADAITNTGSHIRLRNICKNINILNNNFDGNYRAIEYASPYASNDNWLISGNTFKNYNLQDNNQAIITLTEINYIRILNNSFENFSCGVIRDNDSNTSTISEHKYIIDNNIFNTSLTLNTDVIKAFDGISQITNNLFNIPNYNNSHCIYIRSESNKAYISNNSYCKEILENRRQLYTSGYSNSFENIEGCPVRIVNDNASSLTDYSINYDYTQFSKLKLSIGSGEYTYNYELLSWTNLHYLNNRSYKIPVITTNNNLSYVIFTLNANGTISYDSNSTGLNIRFVTLEN